MMRTLKSGLTIGMLVTALAMTGGCGDNDNGGNGNGNDNNTPNPTRTATPGAPVATPTPVAATATPAPTATPGGDTTTQTVDFELTSSVGLQAFKIQTLYPTAKGSFQGSAETVACSTVPKIGIFLPNDKDDGTLVLVGSEAVGALTLPITIECKFDATSAITANDLTVTVVEAVQSSDGTDDPALLSVAVSVS